MGILSQTTTSNTVVQEAGLAMTVPPKPTTMTPDQVLTTMPPSIVPTVGVFMGSDKDSLDMMRFLNRCVCCVFVVMHVVDTCIALLQLC